jgi:hypothetical protein
MRLVIGIIGAACLCGMSLAQANPPSNAPPSGAAPPASTPSSTQSAPAATSSTPAAPAAEPATTANDGKVVVQGTPEYDTVEKHFLAEGYKLEMHGGERMLCRREEEIGSRLGGRKVCSTAQQLQATEREAQAAYQRGQSQQNNPSGH